MPDSAPNHPPTWTGGWLKARAITRDVRRARAVAKGRREKAFVSLGRRPSEARSAEGERQASARAALASINENRESGRAFVLPIEPRAGAARTDHHRAQRANLDGTQGTEATKGFEVPDTNEAHRFTWRRVDRNSKRRAN